MANKDFGKSLRDYMDRSSQVLETMKGQNKLLNEIAVALADARDREATIFIMGNGGSASTASHMANDLNKGSMKDGKKRFRAIALTDNVPVMLAWANDDSYDVIFEEQLKNFMRSGDIVIGISGSGNSKNVLRGMEFANANGATTIGVTGMGGGKLAGMSKICLVVPDDSMQRIEDMHLMLNHMLVYAYKHEE